MLQILELQWLKWEKIHFFMKKNILSINNINNQLDKFNFLNNYTNYTNKTIFRLIKYQY